MDYDDMSTFIGHLRTSAADLDSTAFADRLRAVSARAGHDCLRIAFSLTALVLRGWLKFYHRLEITGRENLPKEGSFVMVANHASHLDTLCLLAAITLRKLHRAFPAAAQDYFLSASRGWRWQRWW